ncbi:MAG: zinc-binding dehydrogenase, partial [Candidatus Nanohaloarchaea archaeon]
PEPESGEVLIEVEASSVCHSDKKEYAEELGADQFINSSNEDVAERLHELGGADAILSTAPVKEAIEEAVEGLGVNGEATVVGVPGEEIEISVGQLVGKGASVSGHSSGTAKDSQDTMEFSALKDVTPEIENYDLEDYAEAYENMMNGDVRFRAVLTP